MRYSYRLWSVREFNLLEEGIKNQNFPALNELEQKLNRSSYSITSFLQRSAEINPISWKDLYLFYSKSFYQERKREILFKRHEAYERNEVVRSKKKDRNKLYYQHLKTRPYAEAGGILNKYIQIKYGKKRGSRIKFGEDLGIKCMTVIYMWISGIRMSWRKYLRKINNLFDISDEDLKILQNNAQDKIYKTLR